MKAVDYILLIDDDDSTNFYHKIVLKDLGLATKMEFAENGMEALEIMRGNRSNGRPQPDVIFLDINMPLMNGFEFLEAMLNSSELSDLKIPVIMLTTSLHDLDRHKAEKFDMVVGYLVKPLTEDTLRAVWTQHISS